MSILANKHTKVICQGITKHHPFSHIHRMGEGGAQRRKRASEEGRIAGVSTRVACTVLAGANPALIRPSGTFSPQGEKGRRKAS
jgi:succinyl-CoA synthetase alpha subunit